MKFFRYEIFTIYGNTTILLNLYSLQIIDATCTKYSCPLHYQLTVHNKCECVAFAPCLANKHWNRHTCQCECLDFQLCGVNRVWNGDTCSCECRSIKRCGHNQRWNSQTCSCECNLIRVCEEEQVWNRNTCSCKCINSCPLGYISNTCKCLGLDLGLDDIEGK